MHNIKLSKQNLHTDLVIEQTNSENIIYNKQKNNNIKVLKSLKNGSIYTTITYDDITDKDNFKAVQETFIKEMKKYLNKNLRNERILIIGLGNEKSTPDSLGPNTINNILVTSYLFALGEVEDGYSNVSAFIPDVMGNTGIETSEIIKSIISITKATIVIIIDALKTNQINRLVKTIQITNNGISPGSGIGNKRKEISKKTMGIDVIAIGVPTVVDIRNIINYHKEDLSNFIVTPTDIDFTIEKLSLLIGNGLNISLHKNFIRQNNY